MHCIANPQVLLACTPALVCAAFAQQMAKLYNNLGLKMMERRKHEEALGLVSCRWLLCLAVCSLRWPLLAAGRPPASGA